MSENSPALVKDVMDKIPDDLDVKAQAKAAVPASFTVEKARRWLSEQGILVAIVYDKGGKEVGLLSVDSLPADVSGGGLNLPGAIAAIASMYCPELNGPVPRDPDSSPKNGKYLCTIHDKWHCVLI
jgi:hypothetical protein